MLDQVTLDMLRGMKLTTMAAELENQLRDASFQALSFEERLGLLVNAEWNRRQTNTVTRLIHKAHFAVPSATIEEIAYYEDRKLDKSQMLRLSACSYIDEGHHIILKGPPAMGRHTSPAHWATPPAAALRRFSIFGCRSCWMS